MGRHKSEVISVKLVRMPEGDYALIPAADRRKMFTGSTTVAKFKFSKADENILNQFVFQMIIDFVGKGVEKFILNRG